MTNIALALVGFFSIIAPGIVILREAGEDDDDWAHWLAKQPLRRIMTLRGLIISGLLFLAAAVAEAV